MTAMLCSLPQWTNFGNEAVVHFLEDIANVWFSSSSHFILKRDFSEQFRKQVTLFIYVYGL